MSFLDFFGPTVASSGFTVAFDYNVWVARYPEFRDTVNAPAGQELFNEATLYLRNDGTVPVSTAAVQSMLLNMLVAHLAQIYFGTASQPASQTVGRISSASEGSVSVSMENDYPPGTVQWFQSTKYGSSFWAATAAYRTARYRPGPRRALNPFLFR